MNLWIFRKIEAVLNDPICFESAMTNAKVISDK